MRFSRPWLAPVCGIAVTLALAAWLYSRLGELPWATHNPPLPAEEPPIADPHAAQILRRCLDLLEREDNAWLRTTVWQRLDDGRLCCEVHGTYQAAPGKRGRLDLAAQIGASRGRMVVIHDGIHLWQAVHTTPDAEDEGKWSIRKINVPAMLGALEKSGNSAGLDWPLFNGVAPLLRNLIHNLTWIGQQTVRRGDRDFLKLTGVWTGPEPPFDEKFDRHWWRLRECRVYLQVDTLWPYRLEWWGTSGTKDTSRRRLVEMEFRDPVLGKPLPPEQVATLFRFPVKSGQIKDDTERLRATLKGEKLPGDLEEAEPFK